MRAARLAGLLAVLVLLVAGCAGGGDDEQGSPGTTAGTTTQASEGVAVPTDGGTADDEPGKVLLSFVRAAGDGDARAMWNLLTEPTRASIGPTFEDFRADAAINFQSGLGTLAPTAKVILSRKLADDWAVAAVSGDRTVEGKKERFAYGAALLPEAGTFKLELGGVVVAGFKPDPLAELDDPRPTLGANVGAGGDLTDVRMWLDGKPFPAKRGANDTPFTASLSGKPDSPLAPGIHEVVVFAATSATATATAWSFTVN